MSRERFHTQKSPFIRIDSCEGNLVIRGWAEPNLDLRGEFQTHDSDKGFLVTGLGDLQMYVPGDAVLSVGKVGGDLSVRHAAGFGSYEYVQGDAVITHSSDTEIGVVHGDLVAKDLIGALSVAEVNGDAVVRGVGDVALKEIHGDLSARLINGSLTVETINGDSDLRAINGDVTIQRSFRDVNLHSVNGSVGVSGVVGDIRLREGLPTGNHSLEARGDIIVRWPEDLPLNLSVSAAKIDNRLHLEDIVEKKGNLTGRIGQGETELSLVSEGRVILKGSDSRSEKGRYSGDNMDLDLDMEFNGIAARIETEVNNHLARVMSELEAKLGADFGRRYSEKAARKAEKFAERNRSRTERKQTGGFDFGFDAAPAPKKATSTQEQLEILKMVENGKISLDEAQMLLDALEA